MKVSKTYLYLVPPRDKLRHVLTTMKEEAYKDKVGSKKNVGYT